MSGTAISIWSKVIEPGQDALVTEDVSIQITQIALELPENFVQDNATKRSILRMQFLEAEPALLSAAAGLNEEDSDFDDDDEDDEDEEIDSDEAEGDESMAAADLSKVSKASTSSKKSNGAKAAAAAELEDDEEDEDEDDEDDSEFEFDRQEAEVQLASLIPGRIEQITTNIVLVGGDDYVFKLSGDYKIHLLGNYVVQPIPEQFQRGGDDLSEYDSELESDLDDDEMGMYDEDEDEDEERFMEIEEKKQPAKKAAAAASSKKEAVPAVAKVTPVAEVVAEAAVDTSKLSKNQKKKLAKEQAKVVSEVAPVAEAAPAAAAPAATKEPAKEAAKKAPSKRRTLDNGLIIEEGKTGSGPVAKAGQRVSMRYIGRLNNGKIFDQNTKGAPFSFKLGKGEVIKGWDTGVPGMQAGGERKLIIPANLAYGKQAISGIPANSTLTFEIKLLSIK